MVVCGGREGAEDIEEDVEVQEVLQEEGDMAKQLENKKGLNSSEKACLSQSGYMNPTMACTKGDPMSSEVIR